MTTNIGTYDLEGNSPNLMKAIGDALAHYKTISAPTILCHTCGMQITRLDLAVTVSGQSADYVICDLCLREGNGF